jgi:hypothetical protein
MPKKEVTSTLDSDVQQAGIGAPNIFDAPNFPIFHLERLIYKDLIS